ncbi:MAG: Na+/H+ antiporter NhaA, partial [Pseudomonadota bacterium]
MWINDALMAVFFLLIGIEIKREVLYGELSNLKRAAMPIIAAIGGMVVPAALYLGINMGGDGTHGWGVPMATDIAFTLGLMALLGSRVPISLKVFVSALAVADDLGAILVIAIFYGHGFHIEPFIAAIALIGIMALLNYKRVYSITVYMVLGIALWFFIFESGLHATLAGVLTAILIPSRRSGDLVCAATQAAVIFDHEIEYAKNQKNHVGIRHGSLRLIQNAVERLREPSYYLEHALGKWVNYAILPLFAFFNTGILLIGAQLDLLASVNLGIILALCIGK